MYQKNVMNLNQATLDALDWKVIPVEKLHEYLCPRQTIAVEPKENGIMLYVHNGFLRNFVNIEIIDYTVTKSGSGEAKIARIEWLQGGYVPTDPLAPPEEVEDDDDIDGYVEPDEEFDYGV